MTDPQDPGMAQSQEEGMAVREKRPEMRPDFAVIHGEGNRKPIAI